MFCYADIAEESLEKCKQRYEELKRREARCRRLYDIDYVHADSTRERLLDRMPHARHSFDLALMQFAFHYSFETLEQAQQLLQNVSDSLKDGGYFVGTTVDALQVISRARHLKTNEIKNDLYRIRLPPEILDPKWRPPLFGFRYDFQLHECVDCPEFMVYFPVVMRLAAAVGLKLVFFDNFVDYFAKKISDENRSLLFKMNGFQTYPPDSGSVFDAREFAHAEQYLRSYPHLRNDGERIGTLSASEWEIASLYCVFAFQKRS